MNPEIDSNVLTEEEKVIFTLRALYMKNGYKPFKMSKFEEYELYVRNKDFLSGSGIITFNDTNGKLLALKPDVTLSIIKNGTDSEGLKQKVCYNENVYRVSGKTNRFKEIMQTGIECIGDIRTSDIFEAVTLAAETLSLIDENFVIDISNLDVLSEIVSSACSDDEFSKAACKYISEKNSHDLGKLCEKFNVSGANREMLNTLVCSSGNRSRVLSAMESVCSCDSLSRMRELSDMLDESRFSDRIMFDFSVINNMSYYNGFVFKGFISNVYEGVLSGGQYDRMMERIQRKSKAIGFALYLDLFDKFSIKGK